MTIYTGEWGMLQWEMALHQMQHNATDPIVDWASNRRVNKVLGEARFFRKESPWRVVVYRSSWVDPSGVVTMLQSRRKGFRQKKHPAKTHRFEFYHGTKLVRQSDDWRDLFDTSWVDPGWKRANPPQRLKYVRQRSPSPACP